MTLASFLKNLTDEQIDLQNKINNLSESGELDMLFEGTTYSESDLMDDEAVFWINKYIKEYVKDFKDFIREETEMVFNSGCCKKNDWTAGLYNCDKLYMDAIANTLDINRDEGFGFNYPISGIPHISELV